MLFTIGVIGGYLTLPGHAFGFPYTAAEANLEGHGDLVSRLITYITHTITAIIPIINLIAKSP